MHHACTEKEEGPLGHPSLGSFWLHLVEGASSHVAVPRKMKATRKQRQESNLNAAPAGKD
jgi:hypothetical protein